MNRGVRRIEERERSGEDGLIGEAIARAFPEVNRNELDVTLVRRTENSRIYSVRTNNGAGFAAKVCLDTSAGHPSPDAAQSQFDALSRLADRVRASGVLVRAPQPVLCEPAAGLVVTDWVPGESLTSLVTRRGRNDADTNHLLTQTGRWLAAFHRIGPEAEAPLAAEQKLTGLADVLELPVATDTVFRASVDTLRSTAAAVSAEPHRWSWLHGDFKPDNVLVSGGEVAGIDFQLRDVNSILNDIAPFLNHLEIICTSHRGWRSSTRRQNLIASFLAGYQSEGSRLPRAALAWSRLYALVSVWGYRTALLDRGIRARLASWFFKRRATVLSAALETACA